MSSLTLVYQIPKMIQRFRCVQHIKMLKSVMYRSTKTVDRLLSSDFFAHYGARAVDRLLQEVNRLPSKGFSLVLGLGRSTGCFGRSTTTGRGDSFLFPTSKCVLLAVRTPNQVKFESKLKLSESTFQWRKPNLQIHFVEKYMGKRVKVCLFR